MLTFTNETLHAQLQDSFGEPAAAIDFLPFSDLEQSVRDDVGAIHEHAFIPAEIEVSGFIYDVETGRLQRVV
jgi:carbonic anhydrase